MVYSTIIDITFLPDNGPSHWGSKGHDLTRDIHGISRKSG